MNRKVNQIFSGIKVKFKSEKVENSKLKKKKQ